VKINWTERKNRKLVLLYDAGHTWPEIGKALRVNWKKCKAQFFELKKRKILNDYRDVPKERERGRIATFRGNGSKAKAKKKKKATVNHKYKNSEGHTVTVFAPGVAFGAYELEEFY
jgi:ribosomal protein S8E